MKILFLDTLYYTNRCQNLLKLISSILAYSWLGPIFFYQHSKYYNTAFFPQTFGKPQNGSPFPSYRFLVYRPICQTSAYSVANLKNIFLQKVWFSWTYSNTDEFFREIVTIFAIENYNELVTLRLSRKLKKKLAFSLFQNQTCGIFPAVKLQKVNLTTTLCLFKWA